MKSGGNTYAGYTSIFEAARYFPAVLTLVNLKHFCLLTFDF